MTSQETRLRIWDESIIAYPDSLPNSDSLRRAYRYGAEKEADLDSLWIKSSERLPAKPGKKRYEQIPCLVARKGEVEILVWNCEHVCWDDSSGDDYECDPLSVDYWMPLIEPPSE